MIDAVIAGAGPGGLSAALCLGRAGRQALVLDGGPWRNVASGEIHNFLSRDGVTPGELRESAIAELRRYPTVKVEAESAESAYGEPGHFQVTLSDGRRIEGRRLLLATGVEDVTPDIAGLSERGDRVWCIAPTVTAGNEWACARACSPWTSGRSPTSSTSRGSVTT
jgi:thioredoxin reductase